MGGLINWLKPTVRSESTKLLSEDKVNFEFSESVSIYYQKKQRYIDFVLFFLFIAGVYFLSGSIVMVLIIIAIFLLVGGQYLVIGNKPLLIISKKFIQIRNKNISWADVSETLIETEDDDIRDIDRLVIETRFGDSIKLNINKLTYTAEQISHLVEYFRGQAEKQIP